jgi:uncharacterized protein with HEPN domain
VKDQRLYLGHIREAIADIRTYAAAGQEAFRSDRMRQDAIIRKLEVIGEAVKQLSDETRRREPAIPWRQIAGMRDHLSHAYFGIDLALVWRVIERDLATRRGGLGAARWVNARLASGACVRRCPGLPCTCFVPDSACGRAGLGTIQKR